MSAKLVLVGGSCSCKQVPGYDGAFLVGDVQTTAAMNVPEYNFYTCQL